MDRTQWIQQRPAIISNAKFIERSAIMKLSLHAIATAMIIAAAPFSAAFAVTTTTPSPTTSAQAGLPTAAPLELKSPTDWIGVENTRFTPVADEVSRRLNAAALALDANDRGKAVAEVQAVADALKGQLADLSRKAGVDNARSAKRLKAAVAKLEQSADDIDKGKLHTRAEFDRAFDSAFLADLDSRWIETDTTTWYPVSEEPQRHFMAAVAAYGQRDFGKAGTEIHKAASYVRLEAGRATGDARQRLNRSVRALDALASSVTKGTLTDSRVMERIFARADNALALSHRAKASSAWIDKRADDAGYELKAAAHGLDGAAIWAGKTAKEGAGDVVDQTRTLGDKLASGAATTADEVRKGFALFDRGLAKVARDIGASTDADPNAKRPQSTQ